jgi:hypothetical protein
LFVSFSPWERESKDKSDANLLIGQAMATWLGGSSTCDQCVPSANVVNVDAESWRADLVCQKKKKGEKKTISLELILIT